MIQLRQECNLFLLALSFYSRIPIPWALHYSPERLAKSSRYIAVVGLLLGSLVSLCYYLCSLYLNQPLSLLLAMLFSVLLTGAFHEDGLADCADGLGSGFDAEKKLLVMRDSRLGTYGACALFFALIIKYQLLLQIEQLLIVIPLIYGLSRAVAASLIIDTPYVGLDDGKAKPVMGNMSSMDLAIIALTAAVPLLLFNALMIWLLLLGVLLRFVAKRFFIKQLGGITGDCLGALQQVSELTLYLAMIVLLGSAQ